MQIKRFEANNMTTALRMVKNELGPEAVILSARSLRKGKGFFGSMKYAGVEVTAAIDARGAPGNAVTANPAYPVSHDSQPNNVSRERARDNASSQSYSAQGRNYQRKHPRVQNPAAGSQRGLSALYQQILSQGVERSLASDLIDEIKRIPQSQNIIKSGDLNLQLRSILEEMGIWADKNALASGKPKIVALLGTAGVGKTTTIAKLAALQSKQYRKQVALISIDNYGITATEQLRSYARIIGIPMEDVTNPNELKRSLKHFKGKDLIFIDTPGINPTDPNQLSGLKSYFDHLPEMQKHLVLSVATKEKDLIRISQAFQEIGVQRLLFTKLDESGTFGNILNVLVHTSIPLSFLSRGRKVPDDIEAGSIQMLVDLIFPASGLDRNSSNPSALPKSGRTAASQQSTTDGFQFVANKNSDVYHSIDCKWSSKIKPQNILQFASNQEAEAQNFLPCRSCNPERSRNDNSSDSRPAARKFSNYL